MKKEDILILTNKCLSNLNTNVADLNNIKIYELLKDFNQCVQIHQVLYYDKSITLIDDLTFDSIYDKLQVIKEEVEKRLWKKIEEKVWWWVVQDWFKKANHIVPLLSLNKCTSKDDIIKAFNQIHNLSWLTDLKFEIEPKFDWLTIELVYKNWELVEASTRWDWLVWDNIFQNALAINNPSLPKKLTWNFDWKELRIRWEVVMLKSVFEQLIKNWEELSNTRNAASWSLKQLDTSITAQRKLTCFAYDITYFWNIIEWDNVNNQVEEYFKTQENILLTLQKLWFKIHDFHYLLTEKQITEALMNEDKMLWIIKNDDCDMDWFVVKLNDLSLRKKLWMTWHHPRSAFAYKYQSEIFETKLLNIEWQIWRTWILTPVWIVQPVDINWAVVSRCSLHNIDCIKEKDIHINDYVYIQRSWEVIPYILWVNLEKRWKDVIEIWKPDKCPVCWDTHIEESISWNNNLTYKCSNVNCRWKLLYSLEFFVSKDVMDIDWLWIAYLTDLVHANLINSIPELYDLLDENKRHQFTNFEWMWDKKLDKIQESLNKSKNNELYRIITWFQIPNIWKNNAKILQKEIYKTYKEWLNAKLIIEWFLNENNYNSLDWFWPIIINWIKNYFNDEKNQQYIISLEQKWINFNNFWRAKAQAVSDWNWIHFSITWTFSRSRPQIVEELEWLWCIFHDKPNKECSVMFIWDKAWSKKEKAIQLWLKIYEWDDWIEEFKKTLK